MRKLIVLAAVLGVVWGGVELAAPSVIESRIEDRARERTREAIGVTADVRSFPTVTRLLLTERVRRVTITFDEMLRHRVPWARFSFDLRGLELERTALFRQEVRIEGMRSGTIVGELDLADALGALGEAIQHLPDTELTVEGRTLQIDLGRPISLPLPDDLLPCAPSASLREGVVLVSCEITEVPEIFLRAT